MKSIKSKISSQTILITLDVVLENTSREVEEIIYAHIRMPVGKATTNYVNSCFYGQDIYGHYEKS